MNTAKENSSTRINIIQHYSDRLRVLLGLPTPYIPGKRYVSSDETVTVEHDRGSRQTDLVTSLTRVLRGHIASYLETYL
jgi:hypothetical protein